MSSTLDTDQPVVSGSGEGSAGVIEEKGGDRSAMDVVDPPSGSDAKAEDAPKENGHAPSEEEEAVADAMDVDKPPSEEGATSTEDNGADIEEEAKVMLRSLLAQAVEKGSAEKVAKYLVAWEKDHGRLGGKEEEAATTTATGDADVAAEKGATNESVEEKDADATPMAVVEEEKGAAVADNEKTAAEGEKDEAVTDGQKDKEVMTAADGEQDDEGRALRAKAVAVIDAWRAGLQVKSKLDAQSHKDDIWYAAAIKEVKTDEAGVVTYTVKFANFSEKHNEKFQPHLHASRLMPFRAYTGKIRAIQMLKKAPEDLEAERRREERLRQQQIAPWQAEEPEVPKEVVTNRYGRPVRRASSTGGAAEGENGNKGRTSSGRKRKASEVNGEEEAAGIYDTQGKDTNDWICGECDHLDREDENDRLVLCDGPCKRSFHQSCLGLTTEALEALDSYLCDQCTEKEHQCFVCGDMGKDHVVGGVHKCLKPYCGKFYHQHCADQMRTAEIFKKQDEVPSSSSEGGSESEVTGQPYHFKFVCSRHACDICGRGKENGCRSKLFTCLRCPRAYHANCLPPGAKFHDYLCLCPEHAHMGLPPLPGDDETYNHDVGDRSDGWLTLVMKSLDLPRGPPVRALDVAHFRLKNRFFDEVYSKPPPFTHIPGLRYTCKVMPTEPGSECQCTDVCDSACLNRILHIECVGNCGKEEGGKVEKYSNCKVGAECTNRAFQNKEYVKHQIFREHGRGWGLRASEDVKKGQLVFEYVGEVIDDEELHLRLDTHARDHPNDHNMYIMELDNGTYLDARHKGNSSRYINHSCDPNCELQKWNVKGYTRIGIVAIYDIPAGTPLSYDYQFATSDESKFKCFCGADNCRGSLAPRPKNVDAEIAALLGQQSNGKLSRSDKKRLIELHRKRERREQAKVEQLARKQVKSLTAKHLPGEPTADIKAGPPPKFLRLAQDARLFMLRNARVGTDFLRRRDLMFRRAAAGASSA